MTLQWIITIAILTVSFMYTGWKIVAFMRPSGHKKTSPCDSFHGDCAGCQKQSRQIRDDCDSAREPRSRVLTK